jgi:hypothetical protein
LIARFTFVSLLFVGVVGIAHADEAGELGVPLPKKSTSTAPYTWHSGDNFKDTLKFYSKRFKHIAYTVHKVMANEKIRVVYLESNDPSTQWEGLNISEKKRYVRVFILARKK